MEKYSTELIAAFMGLVIGFITGYWTHWLQRRGERKDRLSEFRSLIRRLIFTVEQNKLTHVYFIHQGGSRDIQPHLFSIEDCISIFRRKRFMKYAKEFITFDAYEEGEASNEEAFEANSEAARKRFMKLLHNLERYAK